MTRRSSSRIYWIHCPHCQALADVRSSRAITRTYRSLYLDCTNEECGHVFTVSVETRLSFLATVVPSRIANPDLALPVTQGRRRLAERAPCPVLYPATPANDTGPTAANDTGPLAGSEPVRAPEVAPRPANDDDAAQALEA